MRFSNREQGKGDSVRRQTELRDGWLSRNHATLDASLKPDQGVSGFKGKHRANPDRHALAAFLKLVERGRVPEGSYLIVESLDRLSREDIIPALSLLLNLIQAGVRVVQLLPVEAVYDAGSNPMHLMMAIMELSRGHSESAMKSERVGAARAQERKRIRENQEVVTHKLPGWLEERGGRLVENAGADAVRLIFRLAGRGYGAPAIQRKLAEENVPAIGRSGRWTQAYISLLLRDRRVLGEYQPMRGAEKGGRLTRVKEGEPIIGYYPRVIEQGDWDRARAGVAERQTYTGRVGGEGKVNIFAGVLKHARDGDSYIMSQRLSRTDGKEPRRFALLVNGRGDEGQVRKYSVPYAAFEGAFLEQLREIDPHEILNGDQPPDETAALAGRLSGVEAELAAAAAFMDENGFSATIGQQVTKLEAQKTDLAARLAEARRKAAHPLSESWGEMQSLAETLAEAADKHDCRLRIRSALRRIVESIHLLIVPRGRDRRCACQVWFAGGKRCRSYLILHRSAGNHCPGGCWAESFAKAGLCEALDLRRRDHVRQLERDLAAFGL
jgi:DNA invertase Pin-like site-specific DNA recombinase